MRTCGKARYQVKKNEREQEVKTNDSTEKKKAGRPESGKVRGIGFEHKQEVIEDIIGWWTEGYLMTEEPSSIKTLTD